jgi:hypothetical protein
MGGLRRFQETLAVSLFHWSRCLLWVATTWQYRLLGEEFLIVLNPFASGGEKGGFVSKIP